MPHEQPSVCLFLETKSLNGFLSLIGTSVYFTYPARCATSRSELLHVLTAENLASRIGKCLDVVRWIFTRHVAMIGILAALGHIPVDGFKRCTFLPQPPMVCTWFFTVWLDFFIPSVGKQFLGKLVLFCFILKWQFILLNLKPCHKHRLKLWKPFLRCQVFFMEEVAYTVWRWLIHYHGVWT